MLDLAFMGKVLPLYYEGALLTLRVGAIGILLALAVGMVTAVARYWRIPILNTAAVIYTEFSRNTPLLVQLFFLYFGLPKVGIRISGEWCAIIGLAFLGGSYMAEALRAGLESVSTVQTESARVLGLTPFQTMRLVVLPQAVRQLIPPSINLITRMIKTTSLVVLIGIVEVLKTGQQIIDANRFEYPTAALWVYGAVFLLYFLACWPVSLAAKALEKKWKA